MSPTIIDRIRAVDPETANLIAAETERQRDQIRLIASENYVSEAVLAATGTVLTNKYSEGYAGRRYYEGQEVIDKLEMLAVERAKALFNAEHANVQPYSGSPANLAVYTALMNPGDVMLGMGLPAGGHLTHGWKVSATGKFWKAYQYGVKRETSLIDYDAAEALALEHRPRVIVCGASAYPRFIDFERFRAIADKVGAYLVADIAHISGLVVTGEHPHPFPHADVVTTTTHKTLRGPRGGMILCKKKLAKKIDRAVFPGLQGGPHNHTTAGLAVALKEAASDDFKRYAQAVKANAARFGDALASRGFDVISGGTDNHLLIVDVTKRDVTGSSFSKALARAGIVCNANSIPFDPRPPMDPSGIRLGTAAVTSRGFGLAEMDRIAGWMDEVASAPSDDTLAARIAGEVRALCADHPAPGIPR